MNAGRWAAARRGRGRVRGAPLDFEREDLISSLRAHGFDPGRPSVVAWLGTSMYLTAEAIVGVLEAMGAFAPGTQLIMDYLLPEGLRDAPARQYVDAVASFATERGEPWRTFLTPDGLDARLTAYGFETVAHIRQHEMIDAALWDRQDALVPLDLSRIAHARIRD